MRRRMAWPAVAAVVMAGAAAASGWWRLSQPDEAILQFTPTAEAAQQPFSYDDYAAVLEAYVNEAGLVDYKTLAKNRERLDAFAAAIAGLNRAVYDKWSDKQKTAFWINAYNALTLEAIVAHYPIRSSLARSVVYPKNSIRQIPGVWDKLRFTVMGRNMTLNDIEHGTLRKRFDEPRIHMALVCAAMGCPPLRREPYVAERLDAQLDDQARRFLGDPRKFRIDREKGRVYLSPIFKWFAGDFVKKHGTKEAFGGRSEPQRAVLHFISRYLSTKDKQYLRQANYSIKYLKYDWSLNQPAKQ